jgi:hypothetical protein
MQREIFELNRLKKNKNRKHSWPGQLAVYSQPVEVTLYLTPVTYRELILAWSFFFSI